MGLIKDAIRSTVGVENLQYLAAAGILDARRQLAIGERPCASLAKLHIAVGTQDAIDKKLVNCF